jgi:MoaA/NifB/PqqE/SkfB family radical SAM enzyme
LNISIDGTEINHDKQRGFKGAYKKTLATINLIKKKFPEQKIELKMTLTPLNYEDIIYVYELSQKLNCNFSFKPAEYMKNYTNRFKKINFRFNKQQLDVIKSQADEIFLRELRRGKRKEALFYKFIPEYLIKRERRIVKCDIAKKSITIMPNGQVYSCILMESIGNLKKQGIDDIWSSNKAELLREKIENKECPNCMLMCGIFKSFGKL